jgi:hypothetical protein
METDILRSDHVYGGAAGSPATESVGRWHLPTGRRWRMTPLMGQDEPPTSRYDVSLGGNTGLPTGREP